MSAATEELERSGNREMRRTIFLSDDGIVLCATLRALDSLGMLEASLDEDRSLPELKPDLSPSGFGYLRVGLRSLAGQGWVSEWSALEPRASVLRWTEAGRAAAPHFHRYVALGGFLAGFGDDPEAWSAPWEGARAEAFRDQVGACERRWELGDEVPKPLREGIATHLDAALLVPTMIWLHAAGLLPAAGPEPPDGPVGEAMARLLETVGWTRGGGWTEVGARARRYAPHFGIVGSYLPLLSRLPALYDGELTVAASGEDGSREWHVDRELNVRASAHAHSRYFVHADEIIVELFNREPVEAQPRFIADVGCGDGSWLAHLHGLVSERTLRGRHLESEPLVMVGVDFNAAALEAARLELEQAGIPALVVFGDVGDPDSLRSALAERGLEIEDGLQVRAFLDHDRPYLGADGAISVPDWSTGAYVDRDGHALPGADVERSLVAHLRRWAPHVRRHGMVVLEAHCVAPTIASRHLGALHSVAFDAYHAYSHQYPLEHSAYARCCREAGIERECYSGRRYPSSRPFVAVSLDRLLVPPAEGDLLPAMGEAEQRSEGWQPAPGLDPADGEGLHELLFDRGDLRFPRPWCSAATGFVVGGALAAVEERLASAGPGDVIRVLDYGTGTGLAAIELLKACRERGIDSRLERAGATLEVHLADLPSSWFAKGHQLLGPCAWTRFHSLRDEAGGFRPLLEVTGGLRMDAVMANMVFHLIPPEALEAAAANLAEALAPGGRLLWSSPDLGPAGPYAVLFHDPNRALRERWRELLAAGPPAEGDPVAEALRAAAGLDDAARAEAEARAGRRILRAANEAAEVEATLSKHLPGGVESRTYEMLDEETLDALLVPSNQEEFIPEVADAGLREAAIRALMLDRVLPAMHEGPASTGPGLNIRWTLGDFSTRARPRSAG